MLSRRSLATHRYPENINHLGEFTTWVMDAILWLYFPLLVLLHSSLLGATASRGQEPIGIAQATDLPHGMATLSDETGSVLGTSCSTV